MDQHPIQGRLQIFLDTSCYRNQDKLRPDEPLGSYAGFISNFFSFSFPRFNFLTIFCFFLFSEPSIPEEFLSLFKNQTHLLTLIYDYTSMIPDLELLIRGIYSMKSLNQTQTEQNTKLTQNCTIVQNVSSAPVQPACPLGTQAPGKWLFWVQTANSCSFFSPDIDAPLANLREA